MLIDVAAGRLHVESTGAGPPLVLLHGWAMHAGLFAPIVPALAAQHRVHAIDLPGHGHSDPLRPWSLEAVVESLERRFAATHDLCVLGWSLGGSIALEWARRAPSRIVRIVLVATTAKFIADDRWPDAMSDVTLARFADELRCAYKATLLRFLTLQVQGSDEGRAALAALRHQLFSRGAPDAAMLAEALATLRAIDLRSAAPDIRQPTLVVSGTRDTLAPPAAGAWLAAALPAGRLHTLDGAGHAPFLSHRHAFLDVVLRFLRDG